MLLRRRRKRYTKRTKNEKCKPIQLFKRVKTSMERITNDRYILVKIAPSRLELSSL